MIRRRWAADWEGVQLHGAGATLTVGTTAATTAVTIGRVGILTTVAGDLQVDGVTTLVGGTTFTGLLTVTSAASAGAAGVLGPQEFLVQNTQAATAGATIRNPGYQDWQGRFWDGGASVSGNFGRFGAVVDTIAAGVPATYRMVWANTAGTIQWGVSEVGVTRALGAYQVYTALADANPTISVNSGGIGFGAGGASATDVSLAWGAANRLDLATGDDLRIVSGVVRGAFTFQPDSGATVVWNEAGDNTDHRWEADEDANLLYLDASPTFGGVAGAGAVGIGTAAPGARLDVRVASVAAVQTLIRAGSAGVASFSVVNTAASEAVVNIENAAGAADYSFQTATGASVAFATAAFARSIDIGNATGATYVRVAVGTGGAEFGANATAHTTLIGSTTGTSLTSIRGGTGASTWTVEATGTLGLGANATDHSVTIGSVTGASPLVLQAGTGASTLTVTGAGTFSLVAGTGTIGLANNATDHATILGSVTGASALTLQAGTGATTFTAGGIFDVNAVGAVTIDSTAGTIGIGTGADAFAVNIGTGAAARTITIGNVTLATLVQVNAGTGASGWTVTGAGTFSLVAGTGAIALAANATDHATSVGSGTGASAGVFDCGTSGLTLGTTANVHTTTLGSTSGASLALIQGGTGLSQWTIAATGTLGLGSNLTDHTTTVGNGTGASPGVFDCGTTGLTLGTTGNAHPTTLGSTTGASATTVQCGTGTLTLTAGGALAMTTVGAGTLVQSAVSGGATALALTPGNHTAIATVGAFTGGLNVNAGTYTLADAATVTAFNNVRFAAPTVQGLAGGGTETITSAATVAIIGPPVNGGNLTITNGPWSFWVVSGTTRIDGLLDLSGIAAGSPNLQITATSDAVTDPFVITTGVTRAPSGWMEIVVGGAARYVPFWTVS